MRHGRQGALNTPTARQPIIKEIQRSPPARIPSGSVFFSTSSRPEPVTRSIHYARVMLVRMRNPAEGGLGQTSQVVLSSRDLGIRAMARNLRLATSRKRFKPRSPAGYPPCPSVRALRLSSDCCNNFPFCRSTISLSRAGPKIRPGIVYST